MTRALVRVDITNRQQSLRVPRKLITEAVREVCASRRQRAASLSVVVVGDEEMHALNREFLQHDYPTDVLAFPFEDDDPFGEVIVSTDTAIREGAQLGVPPTRELLLYVVHGTLHLTGLRDKSARDVKAMRRAECAIFEALGLPEPVWESGEG